METPNLGYVGVFDVDGTLMTKAMEEQRASPEALLAAHFVRDHFDEHGTFTVATAQTAEMLMSSRIYRASVALGFARKPPKLGGEPGRRYYVKPELIPERVPFTDAKAIMSMGTGCHILQKEGWYREHETYRKRLGGSWRQNVFNLLDWGDKKKEYRQYLAPIESRMNYRKGVTDVMPLPYRIQFNFDDLATKDRIKGKVMEAIRGRRAIVELGLSSKEESELDESRFGDIHCNLRIVDESNPANGKYQFYLMPRYASKEEMVDEMLSVLARGEMIEDLLIAGDMPPDLRAGCFAGRALRATFILVGGSPLAPYFDRDSSFFGQAYAGEKLDFITANLMRTGRPGFEVFERAGVPMRLFVNGDVAYPGLTGPETIAAFLKDEKKPSLF
jgi:hypothetical protein